MDEQKPTSINVNNGLQPETSSIIDRADNVAKRIEEANKKAEELLNKQEALLARSLFAGKAEVAPPVEESPKDYVKRMMRGGK